MLVYLRDETAGLRWPGRWNLPGGGRDEDEAPVDCLLRELREEFGLRLSPDRLVWRQVFPSMVEAGRQSVFFGGRPGRDEIRKIRFGNGGKAGN